MSYDVKEEKKEKQFITEQYLFLYVKDSEETNMLQQTPKTSSRQY